MLLLFNSVGAVRSLETTFIDDRKVSKGAAADTAGGLEEQRRSLNDATHISDVGVGENNDGAQRERSSGDAGITSTELDVGDSSQGRQEGKSSSSGESQPVRNGEDGSDGDDGDDRRHECVQRRPADSASSSGGGKRRQQNARGSTSSAPGDSDESSIVRHRGKEVAETPSSVRRKDQGSSLSLSMLLLSHSASEGTLVDALAMRLPWLMDPLMKKNRASARTVPPVNRVQNGLSIVCRAHFFLNASCPFVPVLQ